MGLPRPAGREEKRAEVGEGQDSLDAPTIRIYDCRIAFTWSEWKRAVNLGDPGLDFVDAPRVFEGATFTFEDDRFSYGERRFVTLGLLAGVPVSIVHTESAHEIRVISFRKATRREERIYFDEVQDRLGSPRVKGRRRQGDEGAP